MNRGVIAVVFVLILVGASISLLLLPRSSDTYHFERDFPEGDYTSVSVDLRDIQDCVLNVSFIDDPDLLFILDFQLYDSAPAASVFDLSVSDYGEGSTLLEVQFEAKERIRSLQLVLGSSVPYEIGVLGSNVNATLIYGNNAIGSDASLAYIATGSFVSLTFTEDMVFSETGMDVNIGSGVASKPDYIYLGADLVDGLNGQASFSQPLSIHAITGWTWYTELSDVVVYATEHRDQQPLLGLALRAEYGVHVWLSD